MDNEPEFRGEHQDEMWITKCQAKEIAKLKEELELARRALQNTSKENRKLRQSIKELLSR